MYELTLPPHIIPAITNLMARTTATDMVSISIRECHDEIKAIISDIVDVSRFHYSNIFTHSEPISIHADISEQQQSILLIPIHAHPDQKFIVFDQVVNTSSPVSWIGSEFDQFTQAELEARYYHKSRRIRPCDDPCVQGLTGQPVETSLSEHLPYAPEFYHGLSGTAWNYQVGKALLFRASNIHATGSMVSPKTGLTVQFSEPELDRVVLATTERTRF